MENKKQTNAVNHTKDAKHVLLVNRVVVSKQNYYVNHWCVYKHKIDVNQLNI